MLLEKLLEGIQAKTDTNQISKSASTEKKTEHQRVNHLLVSCHQSVAENLAWEVLLAKSARVRPRLQLILPADSASEAAAPLLAWEVTRDVLDGLRVYMLAVSSSIV